MFWLDMNGGGGATIQPSTYLILQAFKTNSPLQSFKPELRPLNYISL